MTNNIEKISPAFSDENIDLSIFFSRLLKRKLFIIATTLIGTIIFITSSLMQPDIYKSTALLKVNSDSSSSSSVLNNYQGIASLAGITMPSGRGVEKSELAIQIIKSRAFIKDILTSYDIKNDLIAVKGFDKETKKGIYDQSIIDLNLTYLEVHEIYIEDIIVASKNKENFITISVRHPSPIFAEYFLRIVIQELNLNVKEKDLQESSNAMEYLNQLLPNTSVLDVRNSINKLIEKQLEVKMLASVKGDYVLEFVDPPFIPESKDGPSRIIISIIGFFASLIISVFLVVFKDLLRNQSSKF